MPLPKPPDGYKWIPVEENQNQSSLPPAPKGFKWIPVDDEQPSRPGAPSAQPSVGYDRGFLGDVASRVARGGVQALKGVGGALRMSDLDPESDTGAIASFGKTITDFTDETTQKYDILKPDIGEVQRKEGFVKRGFLGGVESTPASLLPILGGAATGAATGAAVGSILGPGGAVAGGIIGAGVTLFGTFGLGEYQNTYDETKKTLLQKGYGFNEAKNLAHDHALTSAIAETGGEAVGDIAGAVVFKAILKQAVTNGVKQTIKQLIGAGGTKEFAKNLGKSMPFEVGSEMGTAYVQAKSAKKTGISDMSETEAMAEAVLPAAFMSLMFGASIRGLQEVQARGLYSDLNGDDPVTRAKAAIVVSKRMEDAESRRTWLNTANQYIKDGKPIPLNKPIIDFAIQKAEQDSAQDNTTQKPSEPPPGGQTFNGFEDFAGAYQGGATYDDLKGKRDEYSKRPDADPNTLSDVDTFLGEIKPPVDGKIEELKSIHEANGITDDELITQAGKLIAEYPNEKDKIKAAFPNVPVTLTDALKKSESVTPFTDESDALNKSIIENIAGLKENDKQIEKVADNKETKTYSTGSELATTLYRNGEVDLQGIPTNVLQAANFALTTESARLPVGDARVNKVASAIERVDAEIKARETQDTRALPVDEVKSNINTATDSTEKQVADAPGVTGGSEQVNKAIKGQLIEYKAELINKLSRLTKEKSAAKTPREANRLERLISVAETELDRYLREKTLPQDRIDHINLAHANKAPATLPKPPEDSISGKVEAAGAILEQKYPESQIGLRDGKYQIISPDKFTNLKDAPTEDIRLAQVALGDIKENVLNAQNIIFGSNKKGNIKISDSELKALDDVIKSEESEINHVLKRFGLNIDDLIKNPNILEDAIMKKAAPTKAAGEVKPAPKAEGKTTKPEAKEREYIYKSPMRPLWMGFGKVIGQEYTQIDANTFSTKKPLSSATLEKLDLEALDQDHPANIKKRFTAFRSDMINKLSEGATEIKLDDGTIFIYSDNMDVATNQKNPYRITRFLPDGTPAGHDVFKDFDEVSMYLWGYDKQIKSIRTSTSKPEAKTAPKAEGKATKPLRMDGTVRPGRKNAEPLQGFNSLPQATRDKFNTALESKDIPKMQEYLDLPNKNLRAEFESKTGIKLPNTVNGTDKAISDYFTPKPAPKVEAATKVIPTTKTSEKNVTTPKEQKATYQWSDIDKAIENAPDIKPLIQIKKVGSRWELSYPEKTHAATQPGVKPFEYETTYSKKYNTKEDAEIAADEAMRQGISKYPKEVGKVVISTPNSHAIYKIWNTKESLEDFKKRVIKQFPGKKSETNFQRGPKSTGLQQSQVQSVIDKAVSSIPNAPKVNVVQSNKDCPAEVQKIMEQEGIDDAMGFTHNGEVYLVADNLRNQEEVLRTLAHELTHSGLGKFFQRQTKGKLMPVRVKYEALMDSIYRAHSKEIEQLAKTTHTHLDTRTVQGRRQACEEWLCNQTYEAQPKWYDKLVAIFHDLLRTIGLDVKLSDAEVRVVLQDAFKEFGSEGVSFMTAWHGSPHDFDKFSKDKIGTGEGAQAYGYGLYFAGKKEVGEYYRKSFIRGLSYDNRGVSVDRDTVDVRYVDSNELVKDDAARLAILSLYHNMSLKQTGGEFFWGDNVQENIKMMNDAQTLLSSGVVKKATGRLYQVELAPADDELLLWDKPLSEQSEKVRSILNKAGLYNDIEAAGSYFKIEPTASGKSFKVVSDAYEYGTYRTKEAADAKLADLQKAYRSTGQSFYYDLTHSKGSDKAASDYLHSLGIRGIKYLDGSSRGKGEGNFNYVIFSDEDVEVTAKFQRRSPVRRSQPMFSHPDNPSYRWWEGMDIQKQLNSLPLEFWQKPRNFIAMGYVPITRAEADQLYYDGLDIFVAHVNIRGELDTTGNEGIFMRPLSFYGYKYWRYDGTRAQETEATYRYFKYRERYLQGRTGEIARQERRETVPVSEEAPERKVAESEVGYYRYSTKGEGNNLPIDDTIRNYWKKKVEEQYERNRTTRENGDVGFADDSRRERDNRIPYPSRLQLGRLFDENVRGLGEETERPQWESVVFAPELIDTPEFKVARDHFSSLGYTTVPISPVPWGMSVNHNLKAVFISPVSGDNFAYFMSHETSHILSKQGNMSIKAIRDGLDSKHPEFMDMAEQVGYNEDQMREEMSASIVGGWDRYKHLLTGKDSNKSIQDARKATIDSIPNKQETKFQRREKEATLALPPRKLTTNDAKKAWKIVEKADSYAPQEGETPIKHKIFFHSGTGNVDSVRKNGIEPTFGDWVREVLSGATGEEMDIENSFIPLSYYADLPDWLRMQTARKLKKNYYEVTRDDIKNHGYLAVIDNIDDQYGEANHTNIYQVVGENNGPQTVVENAYGEQKKLYETGLYEEGGFGNNREPFGIETGDFITDSGIMPDVVLTGDSLLDFMDAYKAKNPDIRFTRREKEAFDEASEPVPPEYDLGAFESKRKEIDDYVERLRRSLEFPETVMLARDLMGGKFPGIKAIVRSAFGNSAFGKFIPQGDGNILLKASIFNDIETASKTLAHEIGHLVDYIPNHLMTRGNILGRIASLNRYMKNYLEEFKGAPGLLTKEDKSRLQKEAREQIKAEEKPDEIIVEEIIKEIPQFEVSGISPEIILDLMKGRVEGTIAPELYEYLQRAETKEKKQIVMKAMKDMVDERVAQFGIKKQVGIETVKETVEKVIPGVKYDQQTIYKRFKELLQKEINKRVLYRKEVITDELKKLTKLWTPFDDSVDSSYRKYRWSGKELYADAFSVFINYPELMQGEAPTFYKAFLSWIESKPEVKKTYDAYQELATNREAVLERREKYIYEMQKKGDDKDSELIRQIEEENKISPKKVIRELYKGFIDRKVATVEAIKILRKAGKKDVADSLEYLKSEMNYLTAEQAAYADEASVRVIADMKKLGFTEADLGYLATLMRTATQRRDVANPGGMGGFFSDEQIEHLKNKLGVERFNALRGLLDKYTDLRQEFVIPKLEEAGMYSEALMETMKNERNYFTFDVIKFHNKMYGGAAEGSLGQVYHTIGTFQDIKNPFIATIMKDLALMRAAEITKYKKELYKIFSENDELREVYHVEKAKWDWNTKSFKQHEDPNIGLVVYLQNGKIEGFYVSKEIADDFKHKPIEAIHTLRVFNALMMAIKAMLVNRSPIWMIGNVFKDYMTTAQNINGATVTNLLPYYRKAFVDAWKEVRRGEKVDVVQAMKRGKMLVIDRQYSLSESTDDSEFDKLYARFGHHTDIERNVFTKPLIAAWDLLGDLGKVSERAGKIAGYRWLKENTNMSDRYIGHAVRNRIGTPDSYRQGSWQLLINNFFLYFNIGKEGFRSSWESFQENKGEYVWKLVKYNIIPKAVLALAALGAFGDDAEDIISRISNYDKANYLVIPFNKDEKGKVWYLRIPQGHMGQFWGAIMWDIFNLEFKKALQSFSAGQPFSVNPLIKETLNWGLYAMEVNPQDWYRGQSVINRVEWDAGEPYRAFEMSKHTWNSLGGSLLYKPQKGQDTKGVWERLSQFPGLNILGRLLKQSDQGINEAYYEAGEKAKRDAALKRMGKDEAVSKRKRIINILKDNDKRYHEGYIDAQLHSRMDKKYRDMLREN